MESQTQALALTRIVLAKDDLVEQLRSRIPAEWPQCVDEFLTVVRPFDPMSPGVFLAVFADIFHELQRIAGRAATRADGMPLSILIDPCALELSTGGLCDRFERDLREWWAGFKPGMLVPSVQTRRITEYIDRHFAEPITLTKLTAISGWDGRQLARLFRAEMRITIHEYVIRKRIDAAAARLRRGDKVSAAVGWKGRKNFFRQFRKRMGMTPAQFRDAWLDDPDPELAASA